MSDTVFKEEYRYESKFTRKEFNIILDCMLSYLESNNTRKDIGDTRTLYLELLSVNDKDNLYLELLKDKDNV